ncbi:MAG: hypothetical protein IPH35_03350 [Rhodoferax sp.]|nr:hypothetical protein [Rhodoferax sp.]
MFKDNRKVISGAIFILVLLAASFITLTKKSPEEVERYCTIAASSAAVEQLGISIGADSSANLPRANDKYIVEMMDFGRNIALTNINLPTAALKDLVALRCKEHFDKKW